MTADAPARPPGPSPLLDLETLAPAERPFILIDKVRYDLAIPADFGLVAFHRIDSLATRIAEIQRAAGDGDMTDDQAEDLAAVLDAEVAMILRAPDDVRARLNDAQKLIVVEAFGRASRQASVPTPKPNRATRRASRSTGARSSRASSASSARRPGTG